MPPKAVKGKQVGSYKQGLLLKDVLPSREKNQPLEGRSLKVPEVSSNLERIKVYENFENLEDWPGDEQAQVFDFGLESDKIFNDGSQVAQNILTLNCTEENEHVEWKRPCDFIEQEFESYKQLRVQQKEEKWQAKQKEKYEKQQNNEENNEIQIQDELEQSKEKNGEDDEEEDDFDENQEIKITLFKIFQREESQEEYEARKKEIEAKQQDKKQQKKGKKEEVQDEGPKKFNDVKLTNVDLNVNYAPDSRWIASQLQLIKDKNIRDANTNKPIWTKVYPQQDGVPVYNNSGRYWVKFYHMGKEKKIEVDDKLPVNKNGKCKLPRSINLEEQWTSIIAKAYLKYLALTSNISQIKTLTGSGGLLYCLTGYKNQSIPVSSLQNGEGQKTYQFLQDILSDEHFIQEDIHMTVYASQSSQPFSVSNKVRQENQKEQENLLENELKEGETKKKKTKINNNNGQNNNVSKSFAYPVTECFYNSNFNMVYVMKRSEKEVKLRQEFFELSKVSMHKMSKEEKLEYRKKKKELREKITEEDKKRVDLITKPPIQYHLFRIQTSNSKAPALDIECPFNNEEVVISKTCIANKLSKPPNYELPEIRDDGKSVVSGANKNGDESFMMKPLDDFSLVPNFKKILNRGKGGTWLQDEDLKGCFDTIQIYYNPQKLKTRKNIQVNHNPDYEFTQNIDNELIILKQDNENQSSVSKRLLIGFTSSNAKGQEIVPSPYLILQKFDFGTFQPVSSYDPPLNSLQSRLIQLDNKNHVFKLQAFSPLSYYLNIASDLEITTTSVTDYLVDYEDYKVKKFTIDYMPFEQAKYQTLMRFKINSGPEKDQTTFVLKIKSTNDNNMLKYFRLKLVEIPVDNSSYMLQGLEGVQKNLYEHNLHLQNYVRCSLRPSTSYVLLFEGSTPYNVGEGQLEIEFFVKSEELKLEQVDTIEPIEYFDKYIPTKYGLLFRQKLYLSEEINFSLALRLGEFEGGQQQQQQQVGGAKGGAKAAGKDVKEEINEKDLVDQRLIRLELFRGSQLLISNEGYNSTIISNVALKPNNKDESIVYYLQGSFDLRSWPECKNLNEFTSKIYWFLKVISQETIAVVKDTEKEDKEKAIQKSWEDSEPGRAAKAKKSRQKFLILQKKNNGEQLTEEENTIISEPRIPRKLREEDQNAKGGKGKAAKKEEKKPAKGGKQVEVVETKQVQRELPKSENHKMSEIYEFLNHLEQERIQDLLAQHAGLISTRSDENKQEIKEKSQMSAEELTAIFQRNIQLREEIKLLQRDQNQKIQNEFESIRESEKTSWVSYLEKREEIQKESAVLKQKEKEIIEICKQEKPTISSENLQNIIKEAQGIPKFNEKIIHLAELVLKNIKIYELNDKIVKALDNFEIEALTQYKQEIEQFEVQGIEVDLLEKIEIMLEEAADNPNYVQEKLAEQKKQGKKGKK